MLLSAFFVAASCCFSAEISVQIVQHDNALDSVGEQTLVIEDEILDYFFSRGYIVTNEPAVAAKDGTDDEVWKTAFSDAAAGGAQFFIQVRLYYDTAASTNPESVALSNIDYVTWTVTEVQSGKTIADMKGIVDKQKVGNDDADSVKEYAATIADQIQKVLKAKA